LVLAAQGLRLTVLEELTVTIAHLSYRALAAAVEEAPIPNVQAMLVVPAVAVVVVIPAVLLVLRAVRAAQAVRSVRRAAVVVVTAVRPLEMEVAAVVAAESV
jgi:hypothetical protein